VDRAVSFDVVLGGLFSVLAGVDVVAMGEMRMVRSGFVLALGVMAGGFAMMTRSVFVMIRCLLVMIRCFL